MIPLACGPVFDPFTILFWIGSRLIGVVALFSLPVVLLTVAEKQIERRKRDRRIEGRCLKCGYDLRATLARCPECGTASSTRASQSPIYRLPPRPRPPRDSARIPLEPSKPFHPED